MKIKEVAQLKNFSGTVIVPVYETSPKNIVPIEFEGIVLSSKVFYGKKNSLYVVESENIVYLFVGLGKTIDYAKLKTLFRRVSQKEERYFTQNVALHIPDVFSEDQVEAVVSGLLLGTYNLGHFKKKEAHSFLNSGFLLEIFSSKSYTSVINKAIKITRAQLEVLALVDLPPNTITPHYLGLWAKEKGDKHGFDVKILGREAAKIAGLGAFLAVGQGSETEPQFIIMEYLPAIKSDTVKHIGLVGKGVTFDTGGLNIKTAGMLHMKCDMAGAAAVLGVMQLVADLQLPIKLTAIVPCTENSVSSKSFLPSDVITSYSGHSIEIIDTDAEGRLILADAISYMLKNYKPDYLIDIATLTGSSVGTFGYECGALFTNNESLSKQLQKVGDSIGERLWPLPLWDCYKQDIESDIADLKNYSGKPVAGAISAAKFLEFFTEEHTAWAHLDIAGVAFGDDEFAKSKHATAYGVHLLTKFIENI